MLFDGFIRADPELETKSVPLSLKLKDYCFVPVSVCVCVCVQVSNGVCMTLCCVCPSTWTCRTCWTVIPRINITIFRVDEFYKD
jgi:hypothetical protein